MSSPPVAAAATVDVSALFPGARVLARDESRYASGSHKQPSAHAVVAAALALGHDHVVVTSCGNYGRAMAVAARAAGLTCTVLLPAIGNDGGTGARVLGATTVVVDGTYEEAHEETTRFAARLGAVDGNVDGPFARAVLDGGGDVVDKLQRELGEPPATFWVPVGNGTTLTAIGRRAAVLGWPTILHGVSCAGANPVTTSWPGEYTPLTPEDLVTTSINLPLASWHSLHGPEAMAVLRQTGGEAHGVDDEAMVAAAAALAVHHLKPTPGGAVALAGLLAQAAREPLGPGNHVVLIGGRDILDKPAGGPIMNTTADGRQLDDLTAFYEREIHGEETIFDVWERGEAYGDSVTPATFSPPYRRWIRDLLIEELNGDTSGVLSLGCGNASVEAELVAAGHRVLAVDAMPQAVALAQGKGVPVVCADLNTWTPDDEFAVVYMDGVLGHLHASKGVPAILSRIHEWLSRTGRPGTLVLSNDGPPSEADASPAPGVNGFHWLSVRYLTDAASSAGFASVTGRVYRYHRPLSGERLRSVVVARTR